MEMQDHGGPGFGLFPKDTFGVVMNQCGAGVLLGDLVMCDMAAGDGQTVGGSTAASLIPGNVGSILGNVVNPNTNGIGALSGGTIKAGFFFGIVVDLLGNSGGDNLPLKVQWQGIVKKASLAAVAVTPGVSLYAVTGSSRALIIAGAAGNKVLALGWEPNASAAGLFQVIFDGINGFACPAAS